MLSFFRAVVKRQHAFRAMEKVILLDKSGNKEEALNLCQNIVNQYSHDAQFRFRLATLQESLGRPILPDADDSFHNNIPKPAR
jgi:hypothetical protein